MPPGENKLGALHREFRAVDGQRWEVWETHPRRETDPERIAPELAGGWLAFESPSEKRRLAPIPDEWAALSDEDLATLCAQATFVRERGGTGVWPKFPGRPS
jgi:hypothetical protein